METIESLENRFSAKSGNKIIDMYPLTKLITAVAVALVSFFMPGFWYGYAVSAICIILAAYCKKLKSFLLVFARLFFFFVLLLICCRSIFYTGGDELFHIGAVIFKRQGFFDGLELSSVILAFVSSLMMFTLSTGIEDLMIFMEEKGVPCSVSFIVLSAFQMIPEMSARAKTIQDSQKSRGIETEGNVFVRAKAFLPTLGPLVLSSISDAEEKSLALEARGFNYNASRTKVKTIFDSRAQRFARYFIAFLAVAGIAGGAYFKWMI